jgi:hypothetical protein
MARYFWLFMGMDAFIEMPFTHAPVYWCLKYCIVYECMNFAYQCNSSIIIRFAFFPKVQVCLSMARMREDLHATQSLEDALFDAHRREAIQV